jgi:F-box protein, helicase, 18
MDICVSESGKPVSPWLTSEQQAIINSNEDIRINAVAGSGKTTTLIEYAATRPAGSRILYLAFNRSVKLEAKKRFAERGLFNVQVETAHSLAYHPIVIRQGYKLHSNTYKTHEIASLLGLKNHGEKHGEFILANHIQKFISYFCNSDALKVQDLNYAGIVSDPKAQSFVKAFYKHIEKGTRLFLQKMNDREIELTHDFYLKKYQLSQPVLEFDYILFDEGQDASPAMLDVFLKQRAVKLIVGDTHQQIYSWRHAVNSLEKVDFKTFDLSTSFRFNQDIANLAIRFLGFKGHLKPCLVVNITGTGKSLATDQKATIARTNLGLLTKAISFIKENPGVQQIYFEGNINSYTYADDGASLYDVLNLFNNKHSAIRDSLIKSMKDMSELEDYIEKTEDVQLGMMVDIVKKYENEIPSLIRSLKWKHVADEDKDLAEMIFSTVHRAKGMEYDVVELAEDFITESKIEKQKSENMEPAVFAKCTEEINLLYVAATRTKNLLHIPVALLPQGLPASANIKVIEKKEEEIIAKAESFSYSPWTKRFRSFKHEDIEASSYAELRLAHKNAYNRWTAESDEQLKKMYSRMCSTSEMAEHFGRKESAIISRLKRLHCIPYDA